MAKHARVFWRQFRRQYTTTGSVMPSGRYLSRALCRLLNDRDRSVPVRILEVGPGTGPVTAQLVKMLEPHDELTLCELNEEFVTHLKRRFESEPSWNRVSEQTTVEQLPIQQLDDEKGFDFVISGLPLNNFAVADVREIFQKIEELCRPGASVSFFEYAWIRSMRVALGRGEKKKRLQGIGSAFSDFFDERLIARDLSMMNFPPAWAYHVRTGNGA